MKTKIQSVAVPILVLFSMAGCHKSDVTSSDSTNSVSDSTNAPGNQATPSMAPSGTNSAITNLNSTTSPATNNNP